MIAFMLKKMFRKYCWAHVFKLKNVKLAFSEEVAFIQPNTASIISFVFRFSQGINGRLLLPEITFTDFILAIPFFLVFHLTPQSLLQSTQINFVFGQCLRAFCRVHKVTNTCSQSSSP